MERAQHLAALGGRLTVDSLLQAEQQSPRTATALDSPPPPRAAPPPLPPPLPGRPASESLPVTFAGTFKDAKDQLVSAFEREYLARLIQRSGGNIAKAAREANLDRKYLYSLLKKYGLAGGTPE